MLIPKSFLLSPDDLKNIRQATLINDSMLWGDFAEDRIVEVKNAGTSHDADIPVWIKVRDLVQPGCAGNVWRQLRDVIHTVTNQPLYAPMDVNHVKFMVRDDPSSTFTQLFRMTELTPNDRPMGMSEQIEILCEAIETIRPAAILFVEYDEFDNGLLSYGTDPLWLVRFTMNYKPELPRIVSLRSSMMNGDLVPGVTYIANYNDNSHLFAIDDKTNIILTNGEEPTIIRGLNGDESVTVCPIVVDSTRTIGAGDAFVAGFYLASLSGIDLRKSVEFGHLASYSFIINSHDGLMGVVNWNEVFKAEKER